VGYATPKLQTNGNITKAVTRWFKAMSQAESKCLNDRNDNITPA
jgi:hypothetical protein